MDEKIFEWLVDYTSGRLTKERARELRHWLDASTENSDRFEKYLRVVRLHRMTSGEKLLDEESAWGVFQQKCKRRKQRKIVRGWMTAAASLFLVLGVGVVLFHVTKTEKAVVPAVAEILPGSTRATLVLANGQEVDLQVADLREVREEGLRVLNDMEGGLQYEQVDVEVKEPVVHTVQVPVAGEYHFTLADGTKVWVNSASEVTFPVFFSGATREVSVKGEVYFEVQHDSLHPFIVHVNDVAVNVLGTKFNVSAYGEGSPVETTLLEGSVRVENGERKMLLAPGEQALASENGVITRRKVELGMYVSWVQGIFEFENMLLSDITERLARWYDVSFRFEDEKLCRRSFTGMFERDGNLNQILKVIEKTTNVSFEINGTEVVIKER